MTDHQTEQERFWAGSFGDEYIERNRGGDIVAANVALFSKILSRCGEITSVVELGANVGLNLIALNYLLPKARFKAVEINKSAVDELRQITGIDVIQGSLLNYEPAEPCDLAFSKTVLIHVAPEQLPRAYDVLYRSTRRYLLVVEYYNPVPVEITYRGHREKLFKRDFAGEILDRFRDLQLIDYGFVYNRDRFHQDDVTWFLMEKRA